MTAFSWLKRVKYILLEVLCLHGFLLTRFETMFNTYNWCHAVSLDPFPQLLLVGEVDHSKENPEHCEDHPDVDHLDIGRHRQQLGNAYETEGKL